VCNANTLNRCGVAKEGWRTGEAVKKSNSIAEENCGDVDAELVE
jgi:hypothetical protein